jgi:Protein of unknown function (DUF3631)/RepB DNA-primase from phage plasmid
MTPDRNVTESFLRALDPATDRFTFQTFDDDPERREKRRESGAKDPFAKIRHGTLAQHWRELAKLNEQGAGIFVTVNRTDFKGRSIDNIVGIRAVFVDLDGAPLEPVFADGVPMPHIVTETSPDRWHVYWRVENDLPLGSFTPLQQAIAARFNGDPAINDLPRVMRIPGFIHRKADPFLSVVKDINDWPLYGLGALCEAFPLPEGEPATAEPKRSRQGGGKFGALNESALKNLARWVPLIFPTAKKTNAGGYRVASADLGRGFQEDLGLDPRGIKYFGIADQGDKRGGRRTAVEVVAEFQQIEPPEAAAWLEKALAANGSAGDGQGQPQTEAPPPPEPPPQEQAASDDEIEITRLAKLDTREYEKQRKAAADKLGYRASILDKLRDGERARLGLDADDGKLQGHAISFPEPEPWPGLIAGAALLDDLATAIRRHVVMSDAARDTTALWTLHAYLIDHFLVSPRLGITSPVRGCGKTTLEDVVGCLVPRALPTANVTPAALFRVVEAYRPTLMVDEADTFLPDNDELRGVLNSGHRKGGSVVRTVGDDHEPRAFATYCPTVIALIGDLPGTLRDRALIIGLKRKLATETVEPFRPDRADRLNVLARKAVRWTQDNAERIGGVDPVMPDGIINREADNWRPLLAIADVAGGEWPDRARAAAKAAHDAATDDDASLLELLLGDIRNAFVTKGKTVRDQRSGKWERIEITSADLVEALKAIEGRPWADAVGRNRDKALTTNLLARMLKRLRPPVVPQKVGPEDARVSGYVREHFVEPFERYLPPEGASQPDSRTERDEQGTSEISQPDSPDLACPVANTQETQQPRASVQMSSCEGGFKANGRTEAPLRCDHCGQPATAANPLTPYDALPGRTVHLHGRCEAAWFDARAVG